MDAKTCPEAPEEMMAWVIREERHGDPREAMRLEMTAVPRLGPGEVLIRVMAAGINYNGIWLCTGKPLPLSRLKTGYDFHITGSDAAGMVVAVGPGVRRWRPGDEVVVHCNTSCGQCDACNGLDPLACNEQRIWGYETNWGSFAPFARVQAQQLLPKPPRLTWEQAASYGLCLFTAYRMLVTKAKLRAGENVLVWGAAGGLGVFAIQLCLLYGATPIAAVSTDEKATLCRSLGATRIIDRTCFDLASMNGIRDFGKEIRRLTGGRDPDIVFEHIGRETFQASVFVCAKMGRIVICGATSGHDLGFDVRYLWMRQKSILGSHFANAHEATRANELVAAGKVHPIIWKTFPFTELSHGQALLRENRQLGKIVALVQAERPGLGAR